MSIIVEKYTQPTKIAFCGSMGSGKSYAANLLSQKTNLQVMSIAKPIKEIVTEMGKSDRASHIMVGMVGRYVAPDTWIDKLLARVPDEVIIDDVRFPNECNKLKEAGFTLIHLNVPWHKRFARIEKRSEDLNAHIRWFAHESERALENYNSFDYVCATEEEVDKIIDKLV